MPSSTIPYIHCPGCLSEVGQRFVINATRCGAVEDEVVVPRIVVTGYVKNKRNDDHESTSFRTFGIRGILTKKD